MREILDVFSLSSVVSSLFVCMLGISSLPEE